MNTHEHTHTHLEADHRTGGRYDGPPAVGGPHAHHVRLRGAVQHDAHRRIVAKAQICGHQQIVHLPAGPDVQLRNAAGGGIGGPR
eukprot:2954791-Pyramimonas_sp.AAC.1